MAIVVDATGHDGRQRDALGAEVVRDRHGVVSQKAHAPRRRNLMGLLVMLRFVRCWPVQMIHPTREIHRPVTAAPHGQIRRHVGVSVAGAILPQADGWLEGDDRAERREVAGDAVRVILVIDRPVGFVVEAARRRHRSLKNVLVAARRGPLGAAAVVAVAARREPRRATAVAAARRPHRAIGACERRGGREAALTRVLPIYGCAIRHQPCRRQSDHEQTRRRKYRTVAYEHNGFA
mmetsp:Transcript_13496/g.36399  ORF Transcript_13496/g.36399 Transcript_13496/m.36399 type:complete len:235 (-) Transcript_13496:12-716(-)